ncbi:MAG: hypothetical protein WCG95_06025, partial [bacterium]
NTHVFSYKKPVYRNNDHGLQPSSWVTERYVANGPDGRVLKELQGAIDYVNKKGLGNFTDLFTKNAKSQYHMACSAMVERLISKLPKK